MYRVMILSHGEFFALVLKGAELLVLEQWLTSSSHTSLLNELWLLVVFWTHTRRILGVRALRQFVDGDDFKASKMNTSLSSIFRPKWSSTPACVLLCIQDHDPINLNKTKVFLPWVEQWWCYCLMVPASCVEFVCMFSS